MESDISLERTLAPIAECTRDTSGNIKVRIRRVAQVDNRCTNCPKGPQRLLPAIDEISVVGLVVIKACYKDHSRPRFPQQSLKDIRSPLITFRVWPVQSPIFDRYARQRTAFLGQDLGIPAELMRNA